MAVELTSRAAHQTDLSSLCLAITEHAPLPMATVEGASHIVRYVNPAFCRLMENPRNNSSENRSPKCYRKRTYV